MFLQWLKLRKKKKYTKSKLKRQRNVAWFNEYKAKCSCEFCGEDHISCIEFHHVRHKTRTVSSGVRRGWSIKRILKEIAKCIVLCSNCHRKEHYEEV